MCCVAGPSTKEIAALLHIDLPAKGPKSFWDLAQTFPGCGQGVKFYRSVRATLSPRARRRQLAPRRLNSAPPTPVAELEGGGGLPLGGDPREAQGR